MERVKFDFTQADAVADTLPKLEWFRVLGIPVSVTSVEDTAARIKAWAHDAHPRFVCLREVPSLMASRADPTLRALHEDAAIVTPDGMPLAWMGRGLGLPVSRTCGRDLMRHICIDEQGAGLKHFFYGGKEGVAEKLTARLKAESPDLDIVGTHCPPFRDLTPDEEAEVVDKIIASGADVVWVGLSSPRQDLWMWQHRARLPQTLVGVGAAFDFLSGEVKVAPAWMRKRGLESVYRLISEPRRLWRRYLILVPKFLLALLREGSLGTLIKGARNMPTK